MRDEIEKFFFASKEATGKQIAAKVGCDPVDVAKELNRMLAEGLVEREKKQGAGNEYTWWPVAASKTEAPYAPALTFTELLREVAEEPEAAQAAEVGEEKPEVGVKDNFREVDMPLAALCELLAIDILKTETPVKEAVRILAMRSESIARLQQDHARILEANEKLRGNNAALERKIDELTIVDAEFVPSPMFVTVGRYSPPKRHTTLEKAQRRASQLVRSEKEAEVLVCEPVGRVVRGSEWRSS